MTPGESVGTCLRQYSNFRGRATRSEYWWFVLFTWLVTIVVGLASDTAGALALAALLFPCAAAGIRRLHDTDRTGWLILLGGIPLANLVLLYWMVQPGTAGANDYGQRP